MDTAIHFESEVEKGLKNNKRTMVTIAITIIFVNLIGFALILYLSLAK